MKKEMAEVYLERMGYGREIAETAECLEELIWAHLTHVPFENLEIYDEHRVPSLEADRLYEKIVTRRRGGCCFELNGLFYELLRTLGFSARPVAARVVWQKDTLPPTLHRAALVSLGGEEYYCDIGYGGPGPKGLLRLDGGEQTIRGDRFRVTRDEDGWYVISRFHEGAFCPLLCVDSREAKEPDFLLMNFYCARSEQVLFTRKRIVNLCTEAGSVSLTDDTLTIREKGGERRIVCADGAERRKALSRYFGLDGASDFEP